MLCSSYPEAARDRDLHRSVAAPQYTPNTRKPSSDRDLHRYYRPWLDAQSLENVTDGIGHKGLTYEGYRPQAGRDRSLTAFAQLAALRLDTRRAMVSETSTQIVCEAHINHVYISRSR